MLYSVSPALTAYEPLLASRGAAGGAGAGAGVGAVVVGAATGAAREAEDLSSIGASLTPRIVQPVRRKASSAAAIAACRHALPSSCCLFGLIAPPCAAEQNELPLRSCVSG